MKPFDSAGNFISPTESGALRSLAIRGAGVTVFAQGAVFAVQLISTMVLARLLVPADFGVVAIVTTFSILVMSCGQIGFPEAVLQREEIDHQVASNLFWINVALGFLLTLAFAATGPLFAHIYHDPKIAAIVVVISLTIALNNLGVMHLALLKRAMRFSATSANDIMARMVSVSLSVVLGWAGWGYWALVAGAIALPLAQNVGAFLWCRWLPSLPKRAKGTGEMGRFAAHVYARWSVTYFTQNADNFLVGWRFGSIALGVYKKAYDLFVLPFNLLTVYPVAVSTLSRLNKDREKYEKYLLGGLSVLALVGMGLAAELTLVGRDLVRVMLGAKWGEAGRIFTIFGPGIGGMLIYSMYGTIHLSIGTTARYFRWGLFDFAIKILLFLLTLRWGPQGIAAAWTVSSWILIVPAFRYAGAPIRFSAGSVLAAVWRSIASSLLAGVATFMILLRLPIPTVASSVPGSLIRIVLATLLLLVLYFAAIVLVHGGLAPVKQLMKLLSEMVPSGRSPRGPASAVDAGSKIAVASAHSSGS